MTCPTGQKLQLEWYATTPVIYSPADLCRVEYSNEYHAKLLAYKHHRATCPKCRDDMRQPDQPAKVGER